MYYLYVLSFALKLGNAREELQTHCAKSTAQFDKKKDESPMINPGRRLIRLRSITRV